MKRTITLISLLFISAVLPSCANQVKVPDTIMWSYVGDVEIEPGRHVAAIGSHQNFTKHEYMDIDQWVAFLASPAICYTSRDAAKVKNVVDQVCALSHCSYEEQQTVENIYARYRAHVRRVNQLTRME